MTHILSKPTNPAESKSIMYAQFHLQTKIIIIITIALGVLFINTILNEQTTKRHQITHAGTETPTSRALARTVKNDKTPKSAIAVLVPGTDNDPNDLCYALRSLSEYKIVPATTPILVFFEYSFGPERKAFLKKCAKNPIRWNPVKFDFPPDLDPDQFVNEATPFGRIYRMAARLGRGNWGYVQMIRFWNTGVWKHPSVQEFDTLMRIDTDSCFTDFSESLEDMALPGLPSQYDYRAGGPGLGMNIWIKNLYDFTVTYMNMNNITPSNPKLWDFIESSWKKRKTLPVVQTNFEVGRRSFFQRKDVSHWHEAVTEKAPYGVFRFRWGDAQIRVLTAALFGTEDTMLFVKHPGYKHGRGVCAEHFGDATSD